MIFKRRDKPEFWDRTREILYPKKGFWRSFNYIRKCLHRLPDSPHRIALGFACGAVASFTPFFGFHIVIAAALAWVLRGNILAAAFGTVVGNPITFPFIAAAALNIGWWMLGHEPLVSGNDLSLHWLIKNLRNIFLPYLVGGIGPGLITGGITYLVVGPIVEAYQERRRQKLAQKAAERRAMIDRELEAYAVDNVQEDDNA